MSTDLRLHFGEFSLDQRNACVWRGSETLKLKPKAFDVLRYLVENSGQLVSKDDLWREIWPDVAVTDGVLAVCLTEIRQALGDDAKVPRFIETVHRRGYRFLPAVTTAPPVVSSQHSVVSSEESSLDGAFRPSSGQAAAGIQEFHAEAADESPWIPASAGMTPLPFSPQNDVNGEQEPAPAPLSSHPEQPLDAAALSRQRAWSVRNLVFMVLVLLVAVSLTVQYLSRPSLSTQSSALSPATPQALPLPDKPSLIVLPLVNLSGDAEQEYFSDGLTEVLTGDLSKISSLFVIARNSAFTYKGKAAKVQDISREMGVRYVLEGSVQKANQQVRVAVQLIDATTGYEVWSEQYDRPLTDIFALQDEIIQKIVTTLKLQLTLEEQGWKVRKHTDNVEAYNTFLRGKAYYWRYTKESNSQARQLFEKAVTLDPQYAEAYAELGETYLLEWSVRWSTDPQVLQQALMLEQQALALDDALPIAHSLLGGVYTQRQQYDQAIAEEKRAIALDPNNADIYSNLAVDLNIAGRPAEALPSVEHAIRLNPHAPPPYLLQLGVANNSIGRYTEAIAALQALINRSPNFPFVHLLLASSYLLQWLAQESPPDQTLDPAKAEVQRALALDDSWPGNHMILGYIYLCQRQYEQALAEMERAVTLNPTEAWTHAALGEVLSIMGRTEEALQAAAQALLLKSAGNVDEYLASVGTAYAVAGHYEEAQDALQRFLNRYPNILRAHLTLAAVYSELGQTAEAQKEAAEVLRINPHFSLEVAKQRSSIKDPAALERGIAALRKAGLK